MTDRRCAPTRDLATECALGVLTGRERAEVFAHLQDCHACRRHIADLTDTVEDLLALIPAAEPSVGFEARVLTALGITRTDSRTDAVHSAWPSRDHLEEPRRVGRWWRPAAAVAAVALVAATTWLTAQAFDAPNGPAAAAPPAAVTSAPSAPLPPPTASAPDDTLNSASAGFRQVRFAPLIAAGRPVGQVYAYSGRPPWMYMALDADAVMPGAGTDEDSAPVTCRLVHRQGPPTPVGTFSLSEGYDSWGLPADVAADVVGAELTDSHGEVVATATFR